MRRFIITGAPGAGKTAIIRQLELDGFGVVEEAATDVIAAAQARGISKPWTDPSFIDFDSESRHGLSPPVRWPDLHFALKAYFENTEEIHQTPYCMHKISM